MTIENAIRILAGSVVLISVTLSKLVHPYWILLAVFTALNLIQSAFTGICPAIYFLKKLGFKEGSCCTDEKKAEPEQD